MNYLNITGTGVKFGAWHLSQMIGIQHQLDLYITLTVSMECMINRSLASWLKQIKHLEIARNKATKVPECINNALSGWKLIVQHRFPGDMVGY